MEKKKKNQQHCDINDLVTYWCLDEHFTIALCMDEKRESQFSQWIVMFGI
jgi:hypothetical protein